MTTLSSIITPTNVVAVAPGTSGNVLTSNGTTWSSTAPGVTLAGNNAFTGANTFYNSTGQTFGTATLTQDGLILAGRAGGSSSYRVTLTPATLASSTTLTLPNVTSTIAILGTAQTFTSAQTFSAASAVRSEAASTQDAVVLAGRAGGTSSYAVTLTPATLSSSTTLTLPNVTDTVATIGTAQTFTAAQTFRAANSVRAEAASTQDAIVLAGRAGGTSSYAITLTPATLAASRTLTLPDVTGTVLTTGAAVTVAQGGTGATTLTANNVILGNGTSAPLFVAPGTSGNVLTSNGTTWASTAAPTSPLMLVLPFTSSGTYTIPAGYTSMKVSVQGAGGGGGRGTSTTNAYTGGGGGGFVQALVTVVAGQSYTITVGALGAGALSNGSSGTAGGSSSVVRSGGASITANGGSAGGSGTSGGGNTSVSAATVIFQRNGGGGTAFINNGSTAMRGIGGSSFYSDGGLDTVSNAGVQGNAYGAGGNGTTSAGDGGSGQNGIVILEVW